MRKEITTRTSFTLAVLWACLGAWGIALNNPGFAIGGTVLALAFAVLGFIRYRNRRKP
jgi:amino acid permease